MDSYSITSILKSETICPENLKVLYEELRNMRKQGYIEKNEKQCFEVISLIVEYLIYGDKNDPTIFDIFCEYNFMSEFIFLSGHPNRNVHLEIIKSFSVLILNMTSPQIIFFIFSNNFINQIISNDYLKHDDDFIFYYINFLKSLAMKIDSNTIQFFLQKQFNSFPLVISTLKFYNYPDAMIKNTIRTVVLTLLKIEYEPVITVFTTLPVISYFPCLACKLRDLIVLLNKEVTEDNQDKLKHLNEEIFDDILYFQDIFSVGIKQINNVIINSLFYYLIFPLLIQSVTSNKPRISACTSMYILILLFKLLKEESFLNILYSVLFFPAVNKEILTLVNGYPNPPLNYFFEWSEQKKSHMNVPFPKYIALNFSDPFVKSLIYLNKSKYPEVLSIVKKYENENIDITNEKAYKQLLASVLEKIPPTEVDGMQNYHQTLSISTGVNIGLITSDYRKQSVLRIFERFYEDVYRNYNPSNDQGSQELLRGNEFIEVIQIYLRSRDDTLMLLSTLLYNSIFNKTVVSKELILFSLLTLKTNDNHSGMTTVKFDLDSEQKVDSYNFNNSYFLNYFKKFDFSRLVYNRFFEESLIDSLLTEKNLRSITKRVISKNIQLLFEITIQSKVKVPFSNEFFDLVNKTYYTYLSKVKLMMINNQFIKETAFEVFSNEHKVYLQEFDSSTNDALNHSYILIPLNLIENIEDYPNSLKIPKNDKDIFRSSVLIFMEIHDTRYLILNKIRQEQNELLMDRFPPSLTLEGLELNIGESFYYKDATFEMTQCQMKNNIHKNFVNIRFTINKHNIIIIVPDAKDEEKGIVKFKYSLRSVELQIDRSEPRNLCVFYVKDGVYIDIIFSFNETGKPMELKKQIETTRHQVWVTEVNLISEYLDKKIKDYEGEL